MALTVELGNFVGGTVEYVDNIYLDIANLIPSVSVPPVTASAAELSVNIAVPEKSIVLGGSVTVSADAAGNTPIGNVAHVRASSGDPAAASSELVIDFGGMRTVSAVSVGTHATITQVRPWLGTKFDTAEIAGATLFPPQGVQFAEVQTERLQLTLSATVNPADALVDGTVIMTTPPADLELLVDGSRAWFQAGPVAVPFSHDVPIATLLQAAVDAGHVPAKVVLKSRVAGHLSLTPKDTTFLYTHVVVFSGGTTLDVDMAEEGPVAVALPLPADAHTWQVRRVEAVFAGDVGPGRVVPPTGPLASSQILVALDPDRSVVVRLPRGQVRRLSKLTGLRILVAAGASGAELGGTLRSGSGEAPGDPIPGATIGPITVAPSPAPAVGGPVLAWVTLPLAKPLAIKAPDTFVWASIECSRGQVTWPLAAGPPGAPVPELVAVVRRRLPNGNYRSLSAPVGVATDAGVLRVAGESPRDAPISLLEGGIGGTTSTTAFTPNTTGVTLKVGADPAVTASTPGAFAQGGLLLNFTSTSPGRLKVGPVTVAYSKAATS